MKSVSRFYILLVFLSLDLIGIQLAHGAEKTVDPGKAERIKDGPRSIHTSVGTIEVYESADSPDRHYIAPLFRFASIEPSKIAKLSRFGGAEKTIKMKFEILNPNIREEVASVLSDIFKKTIYPGNVGNLPIYEIRIEPLDEDAKALGLGRFSIRLPAFNEASDVSLPVKSENAKEVVDAINEGDITFSISHAYNNIFLDMPIKQLSVTMIADTNAVRELKQQGKELMSAQQIEEAANGIRKELTSKMIEGFGKIEPESLTTETLTKAFSIGDTWRMDDLKLREMEQRLIKQFDLRVDPGKFQPFRIQKKVMEILNSASDLSAARKQYANEHHKNKESWNASGGFSIGSFEAGGDYQGAAEKVSDESLMSDDQFLDLLGEYHGIEYNIKEKSYRGVSVYDLQKIQLLQLLGDPTVTSVTVREMHDSGTRNLTKTPSAKEIQATAVGPDKQGFQIGDVIASILSESDFVKLHGVQWVLCDGRSVPETKFSEGVAQNVPDMRGRFLLGSQGVSMQNAPLTLPGVNQAGMTGGKETFMLTVQQLPPHHHPSASGKGFLGENGGPGGNVSGNPGGSGSWKTSFFTGVEGEGRPVKHLPPFFTVHYYVKVN
jgi:hypothetical protein